MLTLISKHPGHKFRNIDKNPYEIWRDDKGMFVKMFTNKGYFVFDYEDLDKVSFYMDENLNKKYITWHMKLEKNIKDRESYYVRGGYKSGKKIYIHKLILDYEIQNGSITIDHIDRDPLNNRKFNLRFATKKEQCLNTHKRSRMKNACTLPSEIKDIILPKYVCYTKFSRNTKLGYYDLFIIQCHPIQKKNEKWLSKMSMKLTLNEKLKQTLNKLSEYNKLYEQHIQIAGKP